MEEMKEHGTAIYCPGLDWDLGFVVMCQVRSNAPYDETMEIDMDNEIKYEHRKLGLSYSLF